LLPKIKEIRDNIDTILTTEIEKKTRFLKQSYYEGGSSGNQITGKIIKKTASRSDNSQDKG